MTNICFIDFETTGIDVFKDSPIDFGAVLVDHNLEIIKTFQSLIYPRNKRQFRSSAIKTHGIRLEDLSSAPDQNEVLSSFFNEFGTEYMFAGWNINFDVSFFRGMCHHQNKMKLYNSINHRHIDIQSLNFFAKQLKVVDSDINSLSDLSNYFNINRSIKHSALEDAKITLLVYRNLLQLFKNKI